MINITIDKKENILLTKLAGKITAEEIQNNLAILEKSVNLLKKGFAIINDISNLEEAEDAHIQLLIEINKKLRVKYKVTKVIRIIGKSRHLLLRLSQFDAKNGLTDIIYVPTMKLALEEAGKK